MSAKYRVLGTTDDITDCDNCPKTGLRMTVHLGYVDDSGEIGGDRYVGTDCAEKLTGVPAAKVRRMATTADREAAEQRANDENRARTLLDVYLPVTGDRRETITRFWALNRNLRRSGAVRDGVPVKATAEVEQLLQWARTILPGYAPTALHRIEAYATTDGRGERAYAWGCICGRSGNLPGVAGIRAAQESAEAVHDQTERI
jgi:hypothetical protein